MFRRHLCHETRVLHHAQQGCCLVEKFVHDSDVVIMRARSRCPGPIHGVRHRVNKKENLPLLTAKRVH